MERSLIELPHINLAHEANQNHLISTDQQLINSFEALLCKSNQCLKERALDSYKKDQCMKEANMNMNEERTWKKKPQTQNHTTRTGKQIPISLRSKGRGMDETNELSSRPQNL